MAFEQCKEILLKESCLVQEIARLQAVIGEAVKNREWAGFEGYFADLEGIKAELSVLEGEREALFAGIPANPAVGESARFYAFAANFPVEQRTELTAIFRSLKVETLRVQIAGETMMNIINAARSMMTDFFEAAFPDRGGKIYTPHGVPMSHDMRSMVLNRTF